MEKSKNRVGQLLSWQLFLSVSVPYYMVSSPAKLLAMAAVHVEGMCQTQEPCSQNRHWLLSPSGDVDAWGDRPGSLPRMGGGGAGGSRGWRRWEELSGRRGPHVLCLPQDVLAQIGQEHGHLVVHVVVLLDQTGALTMTTVHVHLRCRGGGVGGVGVKLAAYFKKSYFYFGWPRQKKSFADKLFLYSIYCVTLYFILNAVSVWSLNGLLVKTSGARNPAQKVKKGPG